MSEDIPALIAEARESAAFEIDELGEASYTGQLLISLAATLEAEHQRAEHLARYEWLKHNHEVEAERDALRSAIRRALDDLQGELGHLAKYSGAMCILSRAIDTEEQSNGA